MHLSRGRLGLEVRQGQESWCGQGVGSQHRKDEVQNLAFSDSEDGSVRLDTPEFDDEGDANNALQLNLSAGVPRS